MLSLSKYTNAAHLDDFDKNTHTCEKSAIEIDARENFQDISMDTLSIFHSEHKNENRFLPEICNEECLHLS